MPQHIIIKQGRRSASSGLEFTIVLAFAGAAGRILSLAGDSLQRRHAYPRNNLAFKDGHHLGLLNIHSFK
jgi:hypothetical protein